MNTYFDLEDIDSYQNDFTTLPHPSCWQYYKNLKDRIIILNEDITDATIEKFVIPMMEMGQDDSGAPIELYVNTCGGDVRPGFALIDAIEKCKNPLKVILIGKALSMGIYILMAGHNNPNVTTVANKYSMGLIHDGSVGFGLSDAKAIQDITEFNKRYEDTIITPFVLSHSKITQEMMERISRCQYYMTADDMLSLGIIDKII